MLTPKDCTAERQYPSGAYKVWAWVDGYYRNKVYYGYTKREAIRKFVAEINAE